MNEIFVKSGGEVNLGKCGEHLARCAVFDISDWQKTYGEGSAHLLHQRNGDTDPYPCVVEVDGGKVRWHITETDVGVAGRGRAELQYFVGGTRVKSETWATRTDRSLNNVGPVPEEPAENWLNTMLELGAETKESAEAAERSAQEAEMSRVAAEKAVCNAPYIGDNNNWHVWDVEGDCFVDTGVSAMGAQGPALDALSERTASLERQMADLVYEAINITSFSHNAGTKEMGATVTSVNLTWATNKTPTTLTLDGETLDVALTSKALSGLSITKDNVKTWTLKATDERGAVSTKTTSISFQNGIYYGAAAVPDTINSAFVMALANKLLHGTKNRTVPIAGGDGLYAWYAYPKRLGTSLFNIGGFDYEYEVETVSFTNSFGYTENYYVYRSGQYAPASLSVTVKNGG